MNFNIESLLIVMAFIMPGFLTSRLVEARTPANYRQSSAFVETTESVLRSFYINVISSPIAILIFWLLLLTSSDKLLINTAGFSEFMSTRPIQSFIFLFIWLGLTIFVAFIFGYKWDPYQYFSSRLIEFVGFKTRDPWFELRQDVKQRREQGEIKCQLWLQTRLKSGAVYQGEFVYIGNQDKEKSRELLLANVSFYGKIESVLVEHPEQFDYVFLDIKDVDSIDILVGTFE